jgi:long-subunit acyl-CoA synthetase (AMP-forming)
MNCAKAFIKLGLKPHTAVAIIGFNAYPWMVSLYGAIFAG